MGELVLALISGPLDGTGGTGGRDFVDNEDDMSALFVSSSFFIVAAEFGLCSS